MEIFDFKNGLGVNDLMQYLIGFKLFAKYFEPRRQYRKGSRRTQNLGEETNLMTQSL